MGIIFDVFIFVVIILSCRSGAKRGLAATLVSIAVFIISVTGAGFLSRAYSGGIDMALNPFLSGLMESQGAPEVQKELGLRKKGISINDKLAEKPDFIFEYSTACFEKLGITGKTAYSFSGVSAQNFVNGDDASEAVNAAFCEAVAYYLGVIIAFALLIIFLSITVELAHLRPRLRLSNDDNEYYGAIAGFFKGLVICWALSWALSFLGFAIGRHTLESSTVGRFLLDLNYLTRIAIS